MASAPSVLADAVSFADVASLLAARKLTEKDDGTLIQVLKEGVAVEIAGLVTSNPPDDIRDRAERAVAVGTAWHWERSMFPRQLESDASSAAALRDAYLGLREELKMYRAGVYAQISSGPYSISLSG